MTEYIHVIDVIRFVLGKKFSTNNISLIYNTKENSS